MRSTRATELIETYPAHIVNAWMGHTEAVAMACYRQTETKAADKFYEQAAGEKMCGKTVGEHAGMGCFGVEVGENLPTEFPHNSPIFQGYATARTVKQELGANHHIGWVGLEPTT